MTTHIADALPFSAHPAFALAVQTAIAGAQKGAGAHFIIWWDLGTLTVQEASVAPPSPTAQKAFEAAGSPSSLVLRAAGSWQKLKEVLA